MATFAAYLCNAPVTDTPEGDIILVARDQIAKGTFPESNDWDAFERHLIFGHAPPEAVEAAKVVHDQYLATR